VGNVGAMWTMKNGALVHVRWQAACGFWLFVDNVDYIISKSVNLIKPLYRCTAVWTTV